MSREGNKFSFIVTDAFFGDFMKKRLIVRRLLAGIALLVLSACCLAMAYWLFRRAGAADSSATVLKTATAAGNLGLTYAAFDFMTGLVYVATRREFPRRGAALAVLLASACLLAFTSKQAVGQFASCRTFYAVSAMAFVALGMPGIKGFKDMPFWSKELEQANKRKKQA